MVRRSGKISRDFGEALDKIAFPMPVQPEPTTPAEPPMVPSPAEPLSAEKPPKPKIKAPADIRVFMRAKQLQERLDEEGDTVWDVMDDGKPTDYYIELSAVEKGGKPDYFLVKKTTPPEVVGTNSDVSRLIAYVYTRG